MSEPRESPSLSTTMRGLVGLAPLAVPAFGAIVAIWIRVSTQEETIARLQVDLTSRAAAADVTRLEGSLKQLAEKIERRDDKIAEKLDAMSATLERLCTRVRCDR